MSRLRCYLGFIVFLLVFVPCLAMPTSAASCTSCTSATLSSEEQSLWQQIAFARADAGLASLSMDVASISLARARSTDMAQRHYFGHTSSNGTTFLDMMPNYGLTGQFAGETIQRNNYADSPREAARGLIASPEHHAILFDAMYQIGGVGSAVSDDGIHYFTIIVIQP